MTLIYNNYFQTSGYLVKFDSNLSPSWAITLEDSIINSSVPSRWLLFHDIDFDNDSSMMFLSLTSIRGFVGDTTQFFSVPLYDGTPINIKDEAIVMAFKLIGGRPALHSVCNVPSIISSNSETRSIGNLACAKNRIFFQRQNRGGVRFPDTTIRYNNRSDYGLGLVVFDYAGNVIMGEDYSAIASYNKPGPISLQDSVLYLMQTLVSDATFGDIQLHVNERMASIAKYVDTSFMSPYVYTGDTGDVRIALNPDVGAFTSYPNPFRQRVWIRVDNASLLSDGGSPTALLTDLQGHSETVRLEPQGDGLYLLDLSSRPQASYILTLTTTDGHQHSLTLLSQHDYFGQ